MAVRPRPGAQNPGRMISGGMNIEDFIELTNRTECDCTCVGKSFTPVPEDQREDFVDVAEEIGNRNLAYAEEMEAAGNLVTASDFYARAEAMFRVADYGIHDAITDEKKRIYSKIPYCFQKSWALRPEHVETVEIPFEGKTMEAYFAIPDNCPTDSPVLVMIPGATGFKEENYSTCWYFFQRGIPFIIFDGPGQGTSLYFKEMWLTETNYTDAVREVISFVKADPRVGDKIALYGMSYGGYLATAAACELNDDICGLVVRGGTDKTDTLTKHPWVGIENFYLGGFQLKFNKPLDVCSEMSTRMECTDDLHKITCPLLIIHSHADPIIGVDGPHRIYDMVSSKVKYYADYPGMAHCVNDKMDSAGCFGADWMVPRMLEAARA